MNGQDQLLWFGKPVESLEKEKLLEMVYYLARENKRVTSDRDMWRKSGSAISYLLNKGV